MDNNNNIEKNLTISIKTIEKNVSKTYTDKSSNIDKLDYIAEFTNRSFNEVLKEVISNFLNNGQIYDPIENKHYNVKELIEKKQTLKD